MTRKGIRHAAGLHRESKFNPALAPGGLGFHLTHATAMLADADATIRSSAVRDLNRDGYPEVLHIVELRTRINLLRAVYGLPPHVFIDSPLIPGQTEIKTAHIQQMRGALAEVYAAANRPLPVYSGATAPGTSIRAVDVVELREAVTALE